MNQAQKDEVERHLHAARKIMLETMKDFREEQLNPAAVAQVLGENAVQLMIRNYGPDAGRAYCKSLTEEAVRLAHYYRTQVAPTEQE
ncbi:MAG TPA: hypothetical protein VF665_19515 [Longimicrobium sp.]|jgi:hypothetical protein|uniref:hypothetical protein n=1 Tax=Longimicrobium sp. TaxID=2029185 RepID=UPI002ED84A1D